jgi:hypothetical protein
VTDEFIQELIRRTQEHYFKAARYKKGGQRFRKDVTADPVFGAIVRCQKQHEATIAYSKLERTGLLQHLLPGAPRTPEFRQMEKNTFKYLRERAVKQRDPRLEAFVASECLNAMKAGNNSRLNELVKYCEIARKAIRIDKYYIAQPVAWHFYFGLGALQYLLKGKVPFKREVKEAAIQLRAVHEIRVALEQALSAKDGKRRAQGIDCNGMFQEKLVVLRSRFVGTQPKVNTTRIYRDLGLRGLPSAPRHPLAPQ